MDEMSGKYINSQAGLNYAVIALSFFRGRHSSKPRFKHAKRVRNIQPVPVYRDYARLARKYIALARQAGFRGSVIGSVLVAEADRLPASYARHAEALSADGNERKKRMERSA